MNIIIHKHYHETNELLHALFMRYNDREFLNIIGNDDELSQYCVTLNHAIKQLIPLREKYKHYFTIYDKYDRCLAHFLLFSFASYEESEILNYKELILERFHSYQLEKFPYFTNLGIGGIEFDDSKKKQPFIKSMRNLDMDEHLKMEICYAFYDFENCIKELWELLLETKQLLSPYFNQYQILEDQVNANLHDVIREDKLIQLYEFYSISCKEDSTTNLYPTLTGYGFSITGACDHYTFFCGISMLKTEYLDTFFAPLKDRIQDFLKVLSDPSKMDILLYIKDDAHFGSEIAKHLKLSASTISYHLNALILMGIINVKKESNRTYYQLNKQNLHSFILQLQQLFLENTNNPIKK